MLLRAGNSRLSTMSLPKFAHGVSAR